MKDSIYGNNISALKETMDRIVEAVAKLRSQLRERYGSDPVEHVLCRIKDEESMREKCLRKGLPVTEESALKDIHDAIGIRIVCAFVSDVYAVRDQLAAMDGCTIVEEKDYIRRSKPNGYRSLHLILYLKGGDDAPREGYYAEVQIRTISMDTWAALEHHLKYKKEVGKNTDLIVSELKRCADELASTDVSMQTIRDMIREL